MIEPNANSLVGLGIYSIAEAGRLTGVAGARIRRWVRAYTFDSPGGQHHSPAVWQRQLPIIDGNLAVSFSDLIEVRFVDLFLRRGVSWPTIRLAAERAQERFGSTHPFSTRRFLTDGRDVFTFIKDNKGEPSLLDIVHSQLAFRRIMAPFLKDLEFSDDDNTVRWWPLGKKRRVILDPKRSFGQPIVKDEGVPTCVLAQAYVAEESFQAVARWYEVDPKSVRDAIEYEEKLAA